MTDRYDELAEVVALAAAARRARASGPRGGGNGCFIPDLPWMQPLLVLTNSGYEGSSPNAVREDPHPPARYSGVASSTSVPKGSRR